MTFKTEQEGFWAGQFGDGYIGRNTGPELAASNAALFARIVGRTTLVGSVLELGCNIGMNLRALRSLLPDCPISAVEINAKAAQEARGIPGVQVHEGSILEFNPQRTWDLVFTKGVLIHIHPDELKRVYDLMHRASNRYVLTIEYYNPAPVEVPYRGHSGRLFKRDFAGELMDGYKDLRLVDYGFVYRRDPKFPQDDLTWFLLEKNASS